MMDRRTFVCALGGGLFAMPIAAEAQRPAKVYRIGLLDSSAPEPGREAWWNAFRQQMRQIGYVEGQNVRFEPRSAQGDHDRLQMLASELVGLTYGRGGRLRLIATLHDPAV